jgi:hypothetical protein
MRGLNRHSAKVERQPPSAYQYIKAIKYNISTPIFQVIIRLIILFCYDS